MWPRLRLRLAATVVLALLLPLAVAAQAPGTAAYPQSEKGLKQLVEELHAAIQEKNEERFQAMVALLYLAENEAWFKNVFGERFGAYAVQTYGARGADFAGRMRRAFETLNREGLTKPSVEKLDEPCQPKVLESEYPVLFARREKVPIYSVRYRVGSNNYKSLGFFVYLNEGFRYIGHVDLGPVFQSTTPGSLVVAEKVQNNKLIYKPHPRYPVHARRAYVQGTVRLQAIIGRDGAVQNLWLQSGHCWLAEASIEAVRRWRYSPSLQEGMPVEVFTTIDVIFTLSL